MNDLEEAEKYTQEGNLSGLIEMPKPSIRYFTPIYNNYIQNEGQSKMGRQKALENWEFAAGLGGKEKVQKAIDTIIKAQQKIYKEVTKSGISHSEAIQMAKNRYPLEALFKYLPR